MSTSDPSRPAGSIGLKTILPNFKRITSIKRKNFELQLKNRYYYSEHYIPGYEFEIIIDEKKAGSYYIRIEKDFDNIKYEGNIGIRLNKKYWGNQLPALITKSLLKFIKSHGMNKILITCDSGNKPIANACSELSAVYLDTVVSPGGFAKDRYILKV